MNVDVIALSIFPQVLRQRPARSRQCSAILHPPHHQQQQPHHQAAPGLSRLTPCSINTPLIPHFAARDAYCAGAERCRGRSRRVLERLAAQRLRRFGDGVNLCLVIVTHPFAALHVGDDGVVAATSECDVSEVITRIIIAGQPGARDGVCGTVNLKHRQSPPH